MTRLELKQALEAKGALNTTKSQDPLWQEAFKLYNSTNRQNLKISCGGCWPKVREWLKAG